MPKSRMRNNRIRLFYASSLIAFNLTLLSIGVQVS